MFDCFLAQVLVLIMLITSELRIIIIKNARVDCLTIFSPIALVISIINFFCFGFYIGNILIFIVAIFVFVSNFRSVLRFSANLLVDHYSTGFFITAIINLILLAFLSVLTVYFMPVKMIAQDYEVSRTKHVLTGSFTGGLRIKNDFFSGEKFSGNLFFYEPQEILKQQEETVGIMPAQQSTSISAEISEKTEAEALQQEQPVQQDEALQEAPNELPSEPVILFATNAASNVVDYEPYFLILAQKGYEVAAAEFYTPDSKFVSGFAENSFIRDLMDTIYFRKHFFYKTFTLDKELFTKMTEHEKAFQAARYKALVKLAIEHYGSDKKIFLVVDGIDFDTTYSVIDEFPENIVGFYSLNRISEYKTSPFGFIEQTNPFLARQFGLYRDKTLFIPRYAANKTIEYIKTFSNNQ